MLHPKNPWNMFLSGSKISHFLILGKPIEWVCSKYPQIQRLIMVYRSFSKIAIFGKPHDLANLHYPSKMTIDDP